MKNINKLLILTFFIFLAAGAEFVYSQKMMNVVVGLTGSVYNASSDMPATVSITVLDDKGKRVNSSRSNSADGGYYYIAGLKPGMKYTIVLEHKDFLKNTATLSIPKSDKYLEISKDFYVLPKISGSKMKMNASPFELNKSKLRFGSEMLLESQLTMLKDNPGVKVQILTFPDNNTNPSDNKRLTEERAKSIMQYFINRGIEADRITIAGSEKTDPDNPPPTVKRSKGKRYIGSAYFLITGV